MFVPGSGRNEKSVREIIVNTLAPDEEWKGFDGPMSFIETLTYAVYLKDDNRPLLLEALKVKWPQGVEKHMEESETLVAKEMQEAISA